MEKFKLFSDEAYQNNIDWLEEQRQLKRYNLVAQYKNYRKLRSLSQNKLYWLYMGCLEQETGNDKEYLHKVFLKKFAPRIEVLGEMVSRRSKELKTDEFKRYIDKIVVYCSSELGIKLPDPEEKMFNDFMEMYEKFI